MKFRAEGSRVVAKDDVEVALATDEAWAQTIAEVLSSRPTHVGNLKRISVLVSRLEDHLYDQSWADDETREIVDEIRRVVVDSGVGEITSALP